MSGQSKEINRALIRSRKGQPKVKRPPGFPQTHDKASREFIKALEPKNKDKARRERRKSGFNKDEFTSSLASIGAHILAGERQSSTGESPGCDEPPQPEVGLGTAALGLGALGVGSVAAFMSARTTLAEATEAINEARPEIGRAAEAINNLASEGIKVEHTSAFDGLAKPIIDFVMKQSTRLRMNMPSARGIIMKVLALVGAIYAYTSRNPVVVVGACAFFGAAYGATAINAFLRLMDRLGGSNPGSAQSGGTETEVDEEARPCPTTLVLEFFTEHLSSLYNLTPDLGQVKRMFKEVATFSRDLRYVKDLYTLIFDFVSKIFCSAYRYLTGHECEWRLFTGGNQRAYKEMNRFTDIMAAYNAQEIDVYSYIAMLADCLDNMRTAAADCAPGSSQRTEIGTMISRASNALVSAKASIGGGSETRQEPVGVVFVGPPKCGKTVATSFLSRYFAYVLGNESQRYKWLTEPESIASGVWNENLTSKYADGHTGQNVHVIDEVTNEPISDDYPLSARILKYINTAPLPLTRAELEKKGNDYYRAKLLLGTTNVMNWAKPVGVASSEAFYRRVNFYYCTVLDEFSETVSGQKVLSLDEQLHMTKCQTDFNDGTIDMESYIKLAFRGIRFHPQPMSARRGQVGDTSKSLTFQEVIEAVKKEIDIKQQWHEANRTTNNKLIGSFASAMGDTIESLASKTKNTPPPPKKKGKDKPSKKTLASDEEKRKNAGESEFGKIADSMKSIYYAIARYAKFGRCPSNDIFKIAEKLPEGYGVSKRGSLIDFTYTGRMSHTRLKKLVVEGLKNPLAWVMYQADDEDKFEKMFGDYAKDTWRAVGTCIDEIRNIKLDEDALARLAYNAAHIAEKRHESDIEEITFAAIICQYLHSTADREKYYVEERPYTDFEHIVYSMAVGATITVTLRTAIHLVSTFFGGDNPIPEEQSLVQVRKPAKARARNTRLVAQGSFNADPVGSAIMNNTYRFKITGNFPGKTLVGCFVMLQNHVALMSNHVVDQIDIAFNDDENCKMDVFGMRSYSFPVQNLYNMNVKCTDEDGADYHPLRGYIPYPGGWDAAVIYMPMAGKILKSHLISSTSAKTIVTDKDLTFMSRTLSGGEYRAVGRGRYIVDPEKNAIVKEGLGTRQIAEHAMEYNISTRPGDCGSPLVARINGNPQIVGVHASGMNGVNRMGQCVMIERETIELMTQQMIDAMNATGENLIIEKPIGKAESGIGLELMDVRETDGETVCGLYTCARVRKPTMSTKTSIVPSPIHDLLEPLEERAPAILEPTFVNGERIDPLENAIEGYGLSEKAPNREVLMAVNEMVMKDFLSHGILPHEQEVARNWEETVVPPVHLEHVAKVTRKTSSGYPLVLRGVNGRKKVIFGEGDEYDFTRKEWKELEAFMDDAEEKLARGERPNLFFMSFLKDERRTGAKRLKPRLISAASLPLVLLFRKYTMGFVNYMIRNRIKNNSALGVNPFAEWTWLAAHHGVTNPWDEARRFIAGDYSRYDKKIHFMLIECFARCVKRFYDLTATPREEKIRDGLFYELAHSRHVYKTFVVEFLGSNSSGNYLTTPFNTYTNEVLTKAAMLHAKEKADGILGIGYMAQVTLNGAMIHQAYVDMFGTGEFHFSFYGDDNLISCRKPSRHPWFRIENISESLLELFGMTYTDDTKSLGATGLRNIFEVSFLKRGFGFNAISIAHSREVNCPLAIESIVDMVRWTKKNDESFEFWQQTVQTALRELSLHDVDTFSLWTKRIDLALRKAGYYVALAPQSTLQELVRGSEFQI